MMGRFITLVATLFAGSVILAASPAAAQRETLDAHGVIDKVKKGVIRVSGIDITSPVAGVGAGAGGGSGFLFEIDYDTGTGYAITNHHVSGVNMVAQVKFWNDATYRADLVATEPGIDISLIKLHGLPDERNLPDAEKTIVPVVLGDSDQVRIGEFAVGMGNPGANEAFNINRSAPYEEYLLQQTTTTNVVTGRGTPLEFEVSIWEQQLNQNVWLGFQYGTNFNYAFRVSVPINGGNSGGPLFNARGEVIGINFYGGSHMLMQNHNWSIPINLAKDFVTQVLETGKFEKPWLGLDIIMPAYVRGASEYIEFAQLYRPKDHIEVFGVRQDSPAADAGIQKGDILLEIDGQTFKSAEEVRLYIFGLDIGSEVLLVVKRKNVHTGRLEKLPDPIIVTVGPKRKYNSEFSV